MANVAQVTGAQIVEATSSGTSFLQVDELVTKTALLLEDSEFKRFSQDDIVSLLNEAQYRVARLLPTDMLEFLFDTDNSIVLSSTDPNIDYGDWSFFRVPDGMKGKFLDGWNSIISVYYVYNSNRTFLRKVNLAVDDLDKQNNSLLSGSADTPIYYTSPSDSYIWVQGISSSKLFVNFVSSPPVMLLGNNSSWSKSYKSVITMFAESEGWRIDNKLERSREAYTQALQEVQVLSGNYQPIQYVGNPITIQGAK